MSNIYGYIRVSTRDQNEDRQRIAMREAGVEDNRIYISFCFSFLAFIGIGLVVFK